jgi:hypothetical protein
MVPMVGKSVIYPLSLAPYLASVEMFDEIGMDSLIQKRNAITSYLEFILHEIDKEVESTLKSLILQIKKREPRNYLYCCMVKDEVCLNT